MTVLITGSTGFIGSHLVKEYVELGEKVVAVIHDTPVWTKWLTEALDGAILVQGDIRDGAFLRRVMNQYDVDMVVNLAAQSIVKKAWRDPVNTFDINVMGTVQVLEACRLLEVEKVLIQSTDKVYGNQRSAIPESHLIPTEPYGTSKICSDVIAQCYMNTYDMDILIPRCCNVYGLDSNNRIIPNTIRACLQKQSPIIYREDKSLRQYIYIRDVVDTFIYLLETRKTGVVNIATPECLSQEEVVLKILEFFPDLEPRYIEKPRIKEIKNQSMVPDYPENYTPFDDGIQYTIHAFKKYREDWN